MGIVPEAGSTTDAAAIEAIGTALTNNVRVSFSGKLSPANVALNWAEPPRVGTTVNETVAEPPLVTVPKSVENACSSLEKLPWFALTKFNQSGNTLPTVASVTFVGPPFVTVSEYVAGCPTVIWPGEPTV